MNDNSCNYVKFSADIELVRGNFAEFRAFMDSLGLVVRCEMNFATRTLDYIVWDGTDRDQPYMPIEKECRFDGGKFSLVRAREGAIAG